MSIWDAYERRVGLSGLSKRSAVIKRESRMIDRKFINTLSYHSVKINGKQRDISIINSDNLNEKTIVTRPGEDLVCGELVEWSNNFWLISEKDANNELYTKGKLLQCNHLLKWIDKEGVIREQWCVIEDGTKYLTGEYEDRRFIVTRGDSRIAMTIGRNEHTVKFEREDRFLIDDPESESKLSFLLTKPLKVGRSYDKGGVYSFVLQEVVSTEYDNMELGIADYYKYFPKPSSKSNNKTESTSNVGSERSNWL